MSRLLARLDSVSVAEEAATRDTPILLFERVRTFIETHDVVTGMGISLRRAQRTGRLRDEVFATRRSIFPRRTGVPTCTDVRRVPRTGPWRQAARCAITAAPSSRDSTSIRSSGWGGSSGTTATSVGRLEVDDSKVTATATSCTPTRWNSTTGTTLCTCRATSSHTVVVCACGTEDRVVRRR